MPSAEPCIAIGFLAGMIESHDVVGPAARLFLMIGLLGGFTTYSTFALESFHLASGSDVPRLVANLGLHMLLGLAGATVFRGIEGYGGHSRIHSARILRLSEDLPIVIEIVDTRERITSFLPTVDSAIGEGLATLQPVEILMYRAGSPD